MSFEANPDSATAPRQSAGFAPKRRPGSVRRTSSIDVSWPDGRSGAMRFDGRARDVLTPASGDELVTIAEDALVASINADRTITAIESAPARQNIAKLVGERGGGHLREVLKEVLSDELYGASPLYLILDDISGASLISGWAWSQWEADWLDQFKGDRAERISTMEGVCIGFRSGSSALRPERFENPGAESPAPTPGLRHPEDPEGWHAFTVQDYVGMRRARRIDVWRDNNLIKIDAAFQDSASTPAGDHRMVLHEYLLSATADPHSLTLLSIAAQPRVLPFAECTAAPANIDRLLNTPLGELREQVLTELPGAAGCTHLNDALRALAEVPALITHLPN